MPTSNFHQTLTTGQVFTPLKGGKCEKKKEKLKYIMSNKKRQKSKNKK